MKITSGFNLDLGEQLALPEGASYDTKFQMIEAALPNGKGATWHALCKGESLGKLSDQSLDSVGWNYGLYLLSRGNDTVTRQSIRNLTQDAQLASAGQQCCAQDMQMAMDLVHSRMMRVVAQVERGQKPTPLVDVPKTFKGKHEAQKETGTVPGR